MRPAPDARLARAALLALLAVAGLHLPATAQEAQPTAPAATRPPAMAARDSAVVYRREVFRYYPQGRPDPFRPLIGESDLGVRVDDLALRGIVYHPDPARSVAVIARTGQPRLSRVKVGDRIGGIRILAIRPNSIDVLVEELGVARRASIPITRAPAAKGEQP